MDVAQSKWDSNLIYVASEYFWQYWVIVTETILNPVWPWKRETEQVKPNSPKTATFQLHFSRKMKYKENIKRQWKWVGDQLYAGRPSCLSDMYLCRSWCLPLWGFVSLLSGLRDPSLLSSAPSSSFTPYLDPITTRKNNPCSSALYIPSGIRSYLKNETFGFVNIISNHFIN